MRVLGGTNFARKQILKNNKLSLEDKRQALKENEILAKERASKKAAKRSDSPSHEDYKRAHDKADVKTLSDKELRERLNRLNMEKQYKQLASADVGKGRNFVSNTMKVATSAVTATTTIITLYNNSEKLIKLGKSAINAVKKG